MDSGSRTRLTVSAESVVWAPKLAPTQKWAANLRWHGTATFPVLPVGKTLHGHQSGCTDWLSQGRIEPDACTSTADGDDRPIG